MKVANCKMKCLFYMKHKIKGFLFGSEINLGQKNCEPYEQKYQCPNGKPKFQKAVKSHLYYYIHIHHIYRLPAFVVIYQQLIGCDSDFFNLIYFAYGFQISTSSLKSNVMCLHYCNNQFAAPIIVYILIIVTNKGF